MTICMRPGFLEHKHELKAQLDEYFTLQNLGTASNYLGMQIIRDHANRTIYVNQSGYLRQLLAQLGMRTVVQSRHHHTKCLSSNKADWPPKFEKNQTKPHLDWRQWLDEGTLVEGNEFELESEIEEGSDDIDPARTQAYPHPRARPTVLLQPKAPHSPRTMHSDEGAFSAVTDDISI